MYIYLHLPQKTTQFCRFSYAVRPMDGMGIVTSQAEQVYEVIAPRDTWRKGRMVGISWRP